ncbi:Putative hemolysin [Allopseudospirillum japonicum]|uniref:L-ornithine N(alpha)-acyltransferase n=1 Tax=Allopseudospirillum japonicum TaxID=64971 RepID=A0A1H6R5V5_9GAMM|nr:lysophospholipid acyltransferase family protein [Allopseudospirillum japonicum]SEI46572.1 Putative hemolysin [Allopseudospirillum japonicum]
MIDIQDLITQKYPKFVTYPAILRRPLLAILRHLIREVEINRFLQQEAPSQGFEFIDKVLEYFQFNYLVSQREKENIPTQGRVLIVANHPLGSLDGLALLKLVGEVRQDVKIIANDILMHFSPLQAHLLPIDNLTRTDYRQSMARVLDALTADEAVILFPAGEVSRASATGIKDGPWLSGFVHFARKTNTPILPVFIGGKNSWCFYFFSFFHRPLGLLLLAREMFKQHKASIPIRIGELIPLHRFDLEGIPLKTKIKLLRKHVYRLNRSRKPLFITEKSIAHPEDRQMLRKELKQAESLGMTQDGKQIYLFDYQPSSSVMRELGRLREIAFRRVGEGTGSKRDLDEYDVDYRHLILWDEEELEIVGAYRIAEVKNLIQKKGVNALYTHSLFELNDNFLPILNQSIELGRSFVQPKYWGRRSLDYLWFGIGAYLRKNPHIRYMFGPVTLSNTYPQMAKDLLVSYYRHYYKKNTLYAKARAPYLIQLEHQQEITTYFNLKHPREDFYTLRHQLDQMGVTIPTLYKQYTELCEDGGVHFLDFSVDAAFGYCIDGLVLVDIQTIKVKKRERYINSAPQAD